MAATRALIISELPSGTPGWLPVDAVPLHFQAPNRSVGAQHVVPAYTRPKRECIYEMEYLGAGSTPVSARSGREGERTEGHAY